MKTIKKNYQAPQMEQIIMKTAGMLAASQTTFQDWNTDEEIGNN